MNKEIAYIILLDSKLYESFNVIYSVFPILNRLNKLKNLEIDRNTGFKMNDKLDRIRRLLTFHSHYFHLKR